MIYFRADPFTEGFLSSNRCHLSDLFFINIQLHLSGGTNTVD